MSCTEWKEYKLDEVYEVSNGLSKKREEFGFGYEFLAFTDVFNNYFVPQTLDNLVNSSEMERVKCSIKRGDVFLTRTSEKLDELGRSCVALKDYPNATFNGFTKRLRPIGNVEILPEYAGYYFRSLKFRNAVTSMSSMTTRASLNNDMISLLTITVPTLEEQENIANILSCLDEKIELNNEMNKTLEEMAQCIFKRWFVDFEFPNENGEPYKSSGGEMVDSELGMIPKGWEVQCIGDIGNVITGKTPSAKVEGSYGDECNFITPRDITDSPIILNTERKLSSIGINNLKKNLVCKNSIGVSCIGSNLGEVYITGENSITNQQINTVVLDESHIYPYVYIYLKNMKNEFLNMAGGSAVPIINKTSFSEINILMPDMYILNKFVQSTTCYFERIEENLKENESLIALRDSLFPKLMSGEIDINL